MPITKPAKLAKKPMSELGPCLPHGFPEGGNLVRDFAVRPWTLKEEKLVGRARDKTEDSNGASHAAIVLSLMLERFGGQELEPLKETARRALLSRAYMGDVYYAYIWLRRECMGADVPLGVRCTACRQKVEGLSGNLDSLEIRTVEQGEDALYEYTLERPFTVRGKKIEVLQLGPAPWYVLERMPIQRGLNTGVAKAGLIHGCLRGCNHKDIVLTEGDLENMAKRDVEALARGIDDNYCGPNLAVDVTCPTCGTEFRASLDWTFDSFFGLGSR